MSIKTKEELLDENQALRATVKQLNNIVSKQELTTNLIQHAEENNRAWLEHSPVCTKILSTDFNLNYMSAAGINALRIDDITPYYGKPYPFSFYPDSFKDEMLNSLHRVKEKGKVVTQEAAVVDVDGEELWFHSTLVPIYDDNDQLDYIIVVSIDVTDRKQAENDLVQLNSYLETEVADRTLELEKINKKLKSLSETDPLTKIANRRAYTQRLNIEIPYARRAETPLSLLMIDIDHFKQYNDHYGHNAGDLALTRVAKIIQNTLPRATDMAVRFGGEEFLALLPSTYAAGAVKVAEKIRCNIQTAGIEHLYSDIDKVLTVSIGVSTVTNEDIIDDEILRRADEALYIAKNNGRNQIKQFQ